MADCFRRSPTNINQDNTSLQELIRARQMKSKYSAVDFERFFTISLDLLCIIDMTGNFIKVNKAWERLLGHSSNDLEFKRLLEFIHPRGILATIEVLSGLKEDKQVTNFINRFRCKDGSYRSMEWCIQPQGLFAYAIARDITEQQEVEKKLKEKEENFSRFFETVDDIIIITTLDGKIIYGNKAAAEKLDYELSRLIGSPILQYYPNNYKIKAEKLFHKLLKNEIPSCELPFKKKDGSLLMAETRMWFGKWGKHYCIYSISKDLTKHQTALQKFYKIFDCNPQIMAVLTIHDGRFVDINPAFVEVLGYDIEDVLGHTVAELNIVTNEKDIKRINEEVIAGNSIHNYDMRVRKKDGTFIEGLFTGELIDNYGIKSLLAIVADKTEQRQEKRIFEAREQTLSALALSIKELLKEEDYFKALGKCFDILGKVIRADKICLFQNSYGAGGEKATSQKLEWTLSKGCILSENTKLQNIPFEDLEAFIAPLIKQKPFCGLVRQIRSSEVRKYLEQNNILSIAILPVYVQDKFWGFIGCEEYKYEREWTEVEISTLGIFVSFFEKVIERRLVEEELKASKIIADEAKSLFLANMSHEVRTPMNGIFGMIDLLARSPLSSEQNVYLDVLKKSTESLVNIINNMLDLSKIEAGNTALNMQVFEPRLSIREVVGAMKPLLDEKMLPVSINVSESIPKYLLGDIQKIKQILLNLLSNAVKFTNKGNIAISVSSKKNKNNHFWVEFVISDTGVGIPQDKIEEMFKPFSQADNSASRKYGGTGLGLSICQKLTEMMKGQIWINSSLMSGTKVHFAVWLQRAENNNLIDEVRMLEEDIRRECSTKRSLNVLIVEDNAVNQILACKVLETEGHTFKVAHNGKEAIALFDKEPFDIILMDVQMPEMDGYEATKHIRQKEKSSHTPIIALTAHAMEGDSEKCIEAGMDYYLTKPIYFDKLLALFDEIFEFKQEEINRQDEPIDYSQIESVFKKLNSDEAFFKIIIRKFEENAQELIREIRQAIDSSDGDKLKASAHALKGAAAIFEADKTLELAKELEIMGRDANFENAKDTADRLETSVTQVITCFDRFIAGVKSL